MLFDFAMTQMVSGQKLLEVSQNKWISSEAL